MGGDGVWGVMVYGGDGVWGVLFNGVVYLALQKTKTVFVKSIQYCSTMPDQPDMIIFIGGGGEEEG